MRYLNDELKKKIAGKVRSAPHVFFFLDYDGTLVPIMPLPPMARLRASKENVTGAPPRDSPAT